MMVSMSAVMLYVRSAFVSFVLSFVLFVLINQPTNASLNSKTVPSDLP